MRREKGSTCSMDLGTLEKLSFFLVCVLVASKSLRISELTTTILALILATLIFNVIVVGLTIILIIRIVVNVDAE